MDNFTFEKPAEPDTKAMLSTINLLNEINHNLAIELRDVRIEMEKIKCENRIGVKIASLWYPLNCNWPCGSYSCEHKTEGKCRLGERGSDQKPRLVIRNFDEVWCIDH